MASSSWFILIFVCSMMLLSQDRNFCLAIPHRRKIIYINQEPPALDGGAEPPATVFAGAQGGASASAGVAPSPPPVQGTHTFATAGAAAGTTGSSPSGGVDGTVVIHKQAPNFDSIFNIPISILGAVNQLLNNKQGSVSVSKATTFGTTGGGGGGSYANANADASSSAAVGTVTVNKNPTLYNDIFNIPVTALKSVNQLLNGR